MSEAASVETLPLPRTAGEEGPQRLTTMSMARLTAATVGGSVGLSVITTYLPLILQRFTTSNTLIGLAIGGEGLFGLAIPLAGGALSDRIWTRWGRRRPFMIVAAPFMASALVLAPFQPNFTAVAAVTFLFFAAYHLYMAPYQSLLPDLTPYEQQGRVQGMQTVMRGIGMFLGMVLAGFLFQSWEPLPFLMAGSVVLIVTYLTVSGVVESPPSVPPGSLRRGWDGVTRGLRSLRRSSREHGIRNLLVANFLWESTVAGMRPFVMLYFLYVLGQDAKTGAALLGLIGATYMVAGVLGGVLADRLGRRRVMAWGLALYLAGCAVGYFVRELWVAVLVLPIFGLGGSVVLTLPYALLMGVMPRERVGQFTGLFVMSRALAIVIAPVVTGLAIDLAAPHDPATRGYSIIWPMAAVAILVSIFFFRRTKAC